MSIRIFLKHLKKSFPFAGVNVVFCKVQRIKLTILTFQDFDLQLLKDMYVMIMTEM